MVDRNFKLYFASVVLAIIVLASIFAPLLATHNPLMPDMAHRLATPSGEHWLGTDALGRDMFSRILYGGRVSMLLSLAAACIAMSIGMTVGILSGFYGGRLDMFCTVLSNIFQSIPGVCFMIAIAGVLGMGINSLILALVVTSWAGFSRIVRAEVLQIKEEPFIEGLKCLGCSDWRLLSRHVLPNILNKLLILFTIRVGRGILAIAGMSFLGLGVQPPTPDWSVMVNDAILYYRSAPHLIIIPGLCIFLLIYSVNSVGESLRDRLDVRFNEVKNVD